MKAFTLLLALVSFAAPAASRADSPSPIHASLTALFKNLEGSWDGKGAVRELGADGKFQTTRYEVSSRFEDSSEDDTWSSNTQVETESGMTQSTQAQYAVREGNLFVSANGAVDPVQVTVSTDHSLTYKIQRAELFTGRVFDLSFHVEIGADRKLHGRNTVELNGVVISEDTYESKK